MKWARAAFTSVGKEGHLLVTLIVAVCGRGRLCHSSQTSIWSAPGRASVRASLGVLCGCEELLQRRDPYFQTLRSVIILLDGRCPGLSGVVIW